MFEYVFHVGHLSSTFPGFDNPKTFAKLVHRKHSGCLVFTRWDPTILINGSYQRNPKINGRKYMGLPGVISSLRNGVMGGPLLSKNCTRGATLYP